MRTNFLKRAPFIIVLIGGTIFLMSMSSAGIKFQAKGSLGSARLGR